MRHLALLTFLAALSGGATTTSFVHSDAALGRVVVYRNGIAYFERTAHIEGDNLRLAVPADKVDDFLKSLTVVDAQTGQPAPIAYPTQPPEASAETGLIDMKIALTGPTSHNLRLSYVTEAPSWKPSYRMVVNEGKKVGMQAWAIVDNTSGEDWQDVQLGVGSSSALSFRFDLRSIRMVQRETLHSDDLFARAPPMGGAANGAPGQMAQQRRVVAELSDDALKEQSAPRILAKEEAKPMGGRAYDAKKAPAPAKPVPKNWSGHNAEGAFSSFGAGMSYGVAAPSINQMEVAARNYRASNKQVIVEGFASEHDADKKGASLERANKAREELIRNGMAPDKVVAIGNGQQAGHAAGVRLVEAPLDPPADGTQKADAPAGSDPIGTSHFESKARMSVPRGTSAMVSILNADTDGEVVYFFDAESPRGNSQFPFRAVRVKNPTDSVLESGPVTVFGNGKFIGEGMAEPIPARATAFVPFALDRQVMVERKDTEADRISKILTVQRGVFSTEVQHTKKQTLVISNRLAEPVTVYVRHTVAEGYKLSRASEAQDKLGAAYLFKVEVPAGGKSELFMEESTPIFKSTDIRSNAGMDMVTAYLSQAAVEGPLKSAVDGLLRLHKEMANTEQQIQTAREQMSEYRSRMDELHAQIVTLKAVKTAGPLMQNLEKKLTEVSDKVSKATLDLVSLQEKLMVARIKFQDGVADLSLEKKG